jgi:hypothetical protein
MLKFARINYTYSGLADCWAEDGEEEEDDDLEAVDLSVSPLVFSSSAKDKGDDKLPVERKMGLLASYIKFCFDSILMEESSQRVNATI